MKANDKHDVIYGDEGQILAYRGKPEHFSGDSWYVGAQLPQHLHKAVSRAITGVDGVPSASELIRRISQELQAT